MTIRVIGAGGTARAATETHDAMNGAEYLRERARLTAQQRRVPGFEPVRARLARWVRDEQVEHRGRVSTIYHLVPRAAAQAYRRTVEHAAAAADVPVIVSGPWPPYAFAVLE